MSGSAVIARHLRIHGRVQGVWYRDSMRREAETLQVSGWVRNDEDGSVEAWVEGLHEQVDAIIGWARQGPPLAQVIQVEIEVAPVEDYRGFAIL